MKEIKFQAFVENNIIEGRPAAIYPVENISWRDGEMIAVNLIPCEWIDIRWVTLREYTGLKDRNGVEIYGGDIVDNNWCVGQVIYNGDTFLLHLGTAKSLPDGSCRNYIEYKDNWQSWQVIGNIYENKELLG